MAVEKAGLPGFYGGKGAQYQNFRILIIYGVNSMDYMIEHNIPHLQQEAGISRSPAVLNFIDYFILTQRDGGIKRKMCDFHIKIHVLVSVTHPAQKRRAVNNNTLRDAQKRQKRR